ncbi:hypothetical protein RRG08_047044 [Elysia crispata]|uniref:Uncharacterized protein n=1 Tax=Elysia crispata TaxID=231223 RepID=A0AAE1AVG4_9GAST|nr:hypothetical protein RRG08_047044 [Elysia crispata]
MSKPFPCNSKNITLSVRSSAPLVLIVKESEKKKKKANDRRRQISCVTFSKREREITQGEGGKGGCLPLRTIDQGEGGTDEHWRQFGPATCHTETGRGWCATEGSTRH